MSFILFRAAMPLVLGAALLFAGCATPNAIVLPAPSAWFEGRLVRYVVTDVSHPDMATMMGANLAPRLRDALPAASGQRHALERVYKVIGFTQPTVFPSIPQPLGPASRDASYSPLWRLVEVRWQPGRTPRELRAEEAILQAQEAGDVQLVQTEVVINCAVVWVDGDPPLRGSRLVHEAALAP